MALIVEDGTGRADADAYVSVADADAYLADYGAPASWSSATTTAKEEAIRRATRAMDALYGRRWKGVRKVRTQALDWPRVGVVDRDGYLMDEFPTVIANAAAILASRDVEGTTLVPDQDLADGSLRSEDLRLGSLGRSVTYAGGRRTGKRFAIVESLLRDVLEDVLRVERG